MESAAPIARSKYANASSSSPVAAARQPRCHDAQPWCQASPAASAMAQAASARLVGNPLPTAEIEAAVTSVLAERR